MFRPESPDSELGLCAGRENLRKRGSEINLLHGRVLNLKPAEAPKAEAKTAKPEAPKAADAPKPKAEKQAKKPAPAEPLMTITTPSD